MRGTLLLLCAWLIIVIPLKAGKGFAREAPITVSIPKAPTVQENYLQIPPSLNVSAEVPAKESPGLTEDFSTDQEYLITYYSCSSYEGTADCVSYYGRPVNQGIIASNSLPEGTRVAIEGLGYFVVGDRGGGLGYRHLDIYVTSRGEALQRGIDYRRVKILNQGY